MKAEEALLLLQNGGLLEYLHSDGQVYLCAIPSAASQASLSQLLNRGRHLDVFLNPEAWQEDQRPGGELHGQGIILEFDPEPQGLARLAERLEVWPLENSKASARLVVRAFPRGDVMQHPGVEAALLELISLQPGKIRSLYVARTGEARGEELLGHSDIVASRIDHPMLISHTGCISTELKAGPFELHSFYAATDRSYHWAFATEGLRDRQEPPLIRIESECLTGHVLGSQLCDCGEQMEQGLAKVQTSGHGALIYLRQEGRGIGLVNKLKAYRLQQRESLDTVDANLAIGVPEDARDYLVGALVLAHFGIRKVRLLTNNPAKVDGLTRYGIEVVERVPHIIEPSQHNARYLDTKKTRMGHMI